MATDIPPETVTVAITRADGGLTIKRIIRTEFWPMEDDDEFPMASFHRDVTPEFIEAEIAKRPHVLGNYQSWEIVPEDYITDETDQSFRNAWKHNPGGKKPDHDMDKAKEIHRVFLRKQRLKEFCRLDILYAQADEADNKAEKARIGAIRQKFRDVPEDPRIDACTNVEELKALRLEVLIPETAGVSYMNEKMRISPFIEGNAAEGWLPPTSPTKETKDATERREQNPGGQQAGPPVEQHEGRSGAAPGDHAPVPGRSP